MKSKRTTRRTGRPAKEYSQLSRALCLYRMLNSRTGITLSQIAGEFSVTRRTAYRDLLAIESANVPLEAAESDGPEKRWRLAEHLRPGTITLKISEMLALYLATGLFRDFEGTDLWHALTAFCAQLEKGIEHLRETKPRELSRKFHVAREARRDYRGSDDSLNEILTALLHNNPLELSYRSGSPAAKKHLVHPYTLVAFKHGLYLVGLSHRPTQKVVATFALERIVSCQRRRGEHFEYPADYHPDQRYQGAFGIVTGPPENIVLKFPKHLRRHISSRTWHPSQEISAGPPGCFRVSFRVFPSLELLGWILSFGSQVEVLEPAALRAQAREELGKALGHYAR